MIYIDTSALVKLIIEEPESIALSEWLSRKSELPKVTSDLARIELIRVCKRVDDSLTPFAKLLLSGISTIPISSDILNIASELMPHELRSFDAIHLASAISIGSVLSDFVAYDSRLCSAAVHLGLSVSSPI